MKQTTETIVQHKVIGQDTEVMGTAVLKTDTISTSIDHEPSALYYISKRFIDILLSIIGIIVLVPLFLIIAICIKLEDGGDILYFREIIGYQHQRFFALKFRTMIPDADAYLEEHPDLMQEFRQNMKLKYDPRITRVGGFLRRTSMDELPQLFNVLIGQMSLVGPRMIHPSELPRYGEYGQKRLSVTPGITGLWQLYGRQHDSLDQRISLDMQYVDMRSFYLDLVILLRTLRVFVFQTGV